MNFAYIRVSSDQQNCANQRFELECYAAKHNIKINEYIEETISSRKPLKDRKLGKLLDKIGEKDLIITTEISRLGRNMLEVMSILQQCLEKECEIITIKENYHLGADIQSKVLAFAFSLAAEIERQLISQRTTECLKRLKNEGKHLGRPYGFTYKKLKKKHNKIVELLGKGISKAEIARLMGCTWQTLHRYINECIAN
ncbi:MAG: recombinase family protein [Alphaproteobacteria bacterium]|nr:recombinase family protein [Alphaproteobacteria bacterium]